MQEWIFGKLLLQAASEELIFRGALQKSMRRLPKKTQILTSAAVFALFHLFNFSAGSEAGYVFVQTGAAFFFGSLLSAMALETGSLLPGFICHVFLDAACCLVSGGTTTASFLLYIDPGTGSMLFTLLLGLIGAVAYAIRVGVMKMKQKVFGKVKEDPNRLPFVIFSDNKRYWNIFLPVIREMTARQKEILYLTASEDDPAFQYNEEHFRAEYIGEGNQMFARLNSLNAVIVLSTTPGLDVYQWKRAPKVKWYVHIPHAASEICLYRMFGIDYYDAILLSGQYQADDVRALETLRNLPEKEIRFIGIPYMDEMAKKAAEGAEAPVEGAPAEAGIAADAGETEKKPTVLLAPSWESSAILARYSGEIIEVLLRTGYHVIVRPHPQSFTAEKDLLEKLMKDYPASADLEWNRDLDNSAVLKRSDIMISDFSGVIFEFSLIYNKPVIYTDPDFDLSPYDAWWLKKQVWTVSALPRLGQCLTEENMPKLKAVIDECLLDPRYEEGRRQVREETWMYPGEGAKRAADYLCEKYKELTAKEGENR